MQFMQSAGHSVPETIWVQILHSAVEKKLSPFDSDSKITCLCQSIEINNSKHVCRQSQVRMPNGSGVELAECSLIIGTGCRVQYFLAWSSIAQSVCQQAFSLLEIRFQVHAGYEISGNPTPKYGIIHTKLAVAIVVVILVNNDFPLHVYFSSGNQNYWHL